MNTLYVKLVKQLKELRNKIVDEKGYFVNAYFFISPSLPDENLKINNENGVINGISTVSINDYFELCASVNNIKKEIIKVRFHITID